MRPKGPEIQKRTPTQFLKKASKLDDPLIIAEKRKKIRDILDKQDVENGVEFLKKEPLEITNKGNEIPKEGYLSDCHEDDPDEPFERFDRVYMIQRFYHFITEMTVFLPEGEWKQIGELMVEIKRARNFLSISLRGKNLPKIYKYRVFGKDIEKENFQYAQFSEGERVFNFTQEERKYSTIESSSGGDFSATEIPKDLLANISRFENTVRALLWKKDNS